MCCCLIMSNFRRRRRPATQEHLIAPPFWQRWCVNLYKNETLDRIIFFEYAHNQLVAKNKKKYNLFVFSNWLVFNDKRPTFWVGLLSLNLRLDVLNLRTLFYSKIFFKEWNKFFFRNFTFDDFTFAVQEYVLRNILNMV